jgi:hypothetical protein
VKLGLQMIVMCLRMRFTPQSGRNHDLVGNN